MYTYSHALIGKTVYKIVLDNLGFKLSAGDLKFGCIKPDFSPKLVNIPHYKSESFDIISRKIISMQEFKFNDSPKKLKKFSVELGVILHYIADYFCYPHNNKLMDKMLNHILYEMSLELEIRKYLTKSFDIIDLNLKSYDYTNAGKSLIYYIEENHKKYLKEKPSIFNDIYYSLRVCCIVALNICISASFSVSSISERAMSYIEPSAII